MSLLQKLTAKKEESQTFKTIIKPFSNLDISVEVETLEPLSNDEKKQLLVAIKKAFSRRLVNNSTAYPTLQEIHWAIKNPLLVKKIISKTYL